MTRFRIVDESNAPVLTFTASGVFPAVTYATREEAVLALIFVYAGHVNLRAVPVARPLPPQPRMES